MKDKVANLMDYQVRDIFKKIKDFKNLNPEIENTSLDPDDRWDLFDILEYDCLKKLLNTEDLIDDYDDATGRLEFMDFRDYINYYESKAFGKWTYKIEKGCYCEIPVLLDNKYQNKPKYIEYRCKLERDFLNNLPTSKLIQKNKYIDIFNKEYEKILNNEIDKEVDIY